MKKYAICAVIAVYILGVMSWQPAAALTARPTVAAQAALVFEPLKGQTLYEKNKASKYSCFLAGDILTAVLALENGQPLNNQVTISKAATSVPGDKMFYEAGSKVPLEDLAYAVVLKSASDAAYAIAEFIAPTPEKFLELLNAKAAELNMKNTTFRLSSGYYPQAQTTTAYDISLLVRYALTQPKFSEMFAARAVPLDVNGRTQTVVNQCRFFWLYDDVAGGMAQYSTSQLQDAVIMVKRDNATFVMVIINGMYEDIYADATAAFNYAYANYNTGYLVRKNQLVSSTVVGGQDVDLLAGKETLYTFPIGESYIKNISVDVIQGLSLPLTTDKIVGTAKYELKDGTVIDVSLFPAKNVDLPKNALMRYLDRLKENGDILFVIYVLIGLMLVTAFVTVQRRFKKS